jgi:hexosaminidase
VVKYRVITNVPSDKCDSKIADGACFESEISFTSDKAIAAKDWTIHFSQIAPIQSFESGEFSVKHLNGDLHQITLKESFAGFAANETKSIVVRGMFWSLAESDVMPNYIVSAPGLSAHVIKSTVPYIDKDSGLEILPHVETFTNYETQFKRTASDKTKWLTSSALYQRNANLVTNKMSLAHAIVPTPKFIDIADDSRFIDISNGLDVSLGNVKADEVNAALLRLSTLGVKQTEKGFPLRLSVVQNEQKIIGSYQLNITSDVIEVIGVDTNGVFNGLQSLASLVNLGDTRLPELNVVDEPHYQFRGMLVDVARNFHSKDFILKLLDQMAAYKLNKLHLHLGDDEGWRLEIPSLPELTEIGGQRCFDPSEEKCLMAQLGAGIDTNSAVNGYYSVDDYQQILQAATARHIQVIPSLDMPGHSRSSVKAMTARYKKYQALEDEAKATEFLLEDFDDTTTYSSVQFYGDNTINACLESSYAFVTEVMLQVKKIHADAGQPLTRYHIGADETAGAWIESPACKKFVANNDKGVTDMKDLGAYFVERVAGILSELDIETAGWSDGMEHTRVENMPAIVQANAWDALFWGGHDKVHQLANRNWQIVISTPDALYFDFPHEADPKEHGYYWASRHTNTEKVFQFMPANLPVHAEFWLDREDKHYTADDTKTPLAEGQKYLGIQGQLWSENVRTDDMVEHKIFPRLLALAERAWHQADWAVPYNYQGASYSSSTNVFTKKMQATRDKKWSEFANTLGQKEFDKLEIADISYRLPTVGAIIEAGKLFANIAFPGLTIEYQVNDGEWLQYKQAVAISGSVKVRSRSKNGLRASRITVVK